MLDIKPMAGALGAEIHGLDLPRPLSAEDTLRLRKLLNEYEVIFFRDQDISPASRKLPFWRAPRISLPKSKPGTQT